jgi:hypothetical protein
MEIASHKADTSNRWRGSPEEWPGISRCALCRCPTTSPLRDPQPHSPSALGPLARISAEAAITVHRLVRPSKGPCHLEQTVRVNMFINKISLIGTALALLSASAHFVRSDEGENRRLVVRADGVTFKSAQWPSTISVCSSVSRIFECKVAAVPPLGRKPIVIRKAEDGVTRTDLRGMPKEYWINLVSPDSVYCARTAFETGHECSHVWIDPDMQDNLFVESLCDAMGYIILEEMSREWKNHPRRIFADYSPEFLNYRKTLMEADLKAAGIASADDVDQWIILHRRRIIRMTEGDEYEIAIGVCSIALARTLRRFPNAWGSLSCLRDAVKANWVDFAKWRRLADPNDRPFVEELTNTFGVEVNGDIIDSPVKLGGNTEHGGREKGNDRHAVFGSVTVACTHSKTRRRRVLGEGKPHVSL